MPNSSSTKLQLAQDGYCTVPNILSESLLHALQKRFDAQHLRTTSKANFGESGAFIKLDYKDPLVAELLSWPATLAALHDMAFTKPKLHSFYVSTKPPHAERLAWHSDLFYEYDHVEPAELFLIYYLADTSPRNGCLRVVPGSHLRPDTTNSPVDVPLKAADVFIGDRRILHATHANATEEWRTCLTIAYAPTFDQLAEPIQAMIAGNACLPPKGWDNTDTSIDARLKPLIPIYDGTAKPIS